jgi:hypothetical protein
MIDSEYRVKALFITIPIAVIVGLTAGLICEMITPAMAERHDQRRRFIKNSICAFGIPMFGGLSYYWMEVIGQHGFGYLYLTMSVMNGVCLLRAIRRERWIPELANQRN